MRRNHNMTTKKDLFEDLLYSIINSDSFESAYKAKKLKEAWSDERNHSKSYSHGYSNGHSKSTTEYNKDK
jgi:hypothetical protein